MGTVLVHYRAYKLNAGGRIVSGEWIEAADDVRACELARALCDGTASAIEVWQGARRIAVLSCDEAAA